MINLPFTTLIGVDRNSIIHVLGSNPPFLETTGKWLRVALPDSEDMSNHFQNQLQVFVISSHSLSLQSLSTYSL